MALDVPLTHVYVPQDNGHDRLQRLDTLTIGDALKVIVRLVERVEAAEEEAAAMRLMASHTKTSSKRAKYATNRTR